MSSIVIQTTDSSRVIEVDDGENLLSVLQKNRIDIRAHCGGNGTCGKCLVNIEKGNISRKVLACTTSVDGDCKVTIGIKSSGGIIETGAESIHHDSYRNGFGVAVDLGTSTVVASIYRLSDGEMLKTVSGWNSQTKYGSDVISRVQYINDYPDGLSTLTEEIHHQILGYIEELSEECNILVNDIKQINISGNTIMQHIFAGISPSSIAVYPFKPETLFDDERPFVLFGAPQSEVHFSPCVSGYIGGDITAGLSYVNQYNKGNILFIDIGTNGEMAAGNDDGYICCSVATGPAFEGAHIECGMPAQTGAINRITFDGNKLSYTVIDDKKPVGICGSAVIQLIAILLSQGIISESGRLLPPSEVKVACEINLCEDENGNGIVYITEDKKIYLTANDVRQIQLAKASVMAGIKSLIRESGKMPDKVYIAGGFGRYLDIRSSVEIGMLPEELESSIVYMGNTSLKGTARSLMSEKFNDIIKKISAKCRYLELSLNDEFRDEYIEQMSFTNGRED